MDTTDKILSSTVFRIVVALVGVIAGTARILDYAFPDPLIVRIFSTAGLLLFFIYFLVVIFERVIGRAEDEKVFLHASKRYGIGYTSLEIDCTVDIDGSAIVQRKVNIKAYSEIGELDNFMLIPELSPHGDERHVDLINVKSLTQNRKVAITNIINNDGRLSVEVAITPPLKEGDEFSYLLLEKLPSGLFAIDLTEEDLLKRESAHDYFGWNINRPTQKLFLRVYFPNKIQPNFIRKQVKYASVSGFPSKRYQNNEEKRIKDPVGTISDASRYMLQLSVDYPMIGLIYILRWRPIPKEI